MLKTLIDFIQKSRNYVEISNFIENNFTQLDSNIDNDAYSKYEKTIYELTSELSLVETTSYDYFGASMTGGSSIVVEHLLNGLSFMLFNYDVTTNRNGDVIDKRIEVCDETTMNELLPLYDASNVCTQETFDYLVSNNPKMAIAYWKKLPEKVRNEDGNIMTLLDMVYEKASKTKNNINEKVLYSPYGGLDISYQPSTIGECFYDMMNELYCFFNMPKDDYNHKLIDYILSKDVNDEFPAILEKRIRFLSSIDEESIRQIDAYLATLKEHRFKCEEYDVVLQKMKDCGKTYGDAKDNMDELVAERNGVNDSFWEKVSKKIFGTHIDYDHYDNEISLYEDIMTSTQDEINQCKEKLFVLGKDINELDNVLANNTSRPLATSFWETMYDKENDTLLDVALDDKKENKYNLYKIKMDKIYKKYAC